MFILTATHLLSLLGVPVVLALWVWKGRTGSRVNLLFRVALVGAVYLLLYLAGKWHWASYYLRTAPFVLLLAGAYLGYTKARELPFFEAGDPAVWVESAGFAVAALVMLALSVQVAAGSAYDGPAARLQFPLKQGAYYVPEGGSATLINRHNRDAAQRYAVDIYKLGVLGARATRIFPTRLQDYEIFGEPIYSPCDGMVLSVFDRLPDMPPGRSLESSVAAGNHVVVSCGGAQVLLAHMMSGSIAVKSEDSVKVGQFLGRVGNSGSSSEPHLHVHAGTKGGECLPMLFGGRFLARNSVVRAGE